MFSFNTGSFDVYVTCFSDWVNGVPGLGFRVWTYMVGRALLCLLLGLLLYPLLNLAFRLVSKPTHVWFQTPSHIIYYSLTIDYSKI